jgi:hypothetical protein
VTTPRVGKPSDIGIKPTISGRVLAPVGKLMWGLPSGSITRGGGSTAVVLTREGSVHVLVDIGGQVVEFDVSPRLREQLQDRVAPR